MKNKIQVQQLELGDMANFSYIISDRSSGEAAVIDPHDDTATIEKAVQKNGLKVTTILLTHGHYDHTGGLPYYSDQLKLPVFISQDELPMYLPSCTTFKKFSDAYEITLGSLQIKCLSTPGHTPGCVSFLVDGNLFTGDTLFVEAIGRTDFPGGNADELFTSLQKIKQLPDNTIIWPGHDYGSTPSGTLQLLKKRNPYLVCATREEFMDLAG